MKKLILAVALIAATGAHAMTQLQSEVAQQLPEYGFHNVDVEKLSNSQLAEIKHFLTSGMGAGDIKGHISGILKGSDVHIKSN